MNDAVLQPEWRKGFVPGPDTKFKKGQSGNPAGKPKGVKDKRAKLLNTLLTEAGEVVDAVLARAKEGDAASAALVLGRVLPALRAQSQTVEFQFDPEASITVQIQQVLAAVAAGEVPPDTGEQIIRAIGTLSQARVTEELAAEVAALKARDIMP
jgi:hypothetical protein